MYNPWGACQSDNTQARTVATSSPSGCTGTPVISQSCTYTPPVTTVTAANVASSCTGCHGLTSNSTVFKSGGYTISGRTAADWLTTVNNMTGLGASLTPAGVTAQDYANFLAAQPVATTACTSFSYSAWGACQSDSTQTRTLTSSLPAGCTGGTPLLSQSCTYVPPTTACTSFTYSAWGTCQSNSTQSRTVVSSSPAGCTGGTPALTQACVYVPPVTTVTAANVASSCTGCHGLTSNSTVFKSGGYMISGRNATDWLTTVNNMIGLGASLTPAGATAQDYANFLAAQPVATTACTSFSYSAWGACQSDSTQTRTLTSSLPSGCTGGTPVLSQSCTYVPPTTACTSFTYSAWGTCQSNSTQSRTVATSLPAGCTGGTPALTQACVYVPPTPTLTLAQVTTSCTRCHGLTVNTTVLKSGGYSVSGRSASAWVSAITGMGATLAPGTTLQDYGNFLTALP